MRAPYYVSDNRSDIRGIKPGWYAIEEGGELSSGPFSSRQECAANITRIPLPSRRPE